MVKRARQAKKALPEFSPEKQIALDLAVIMAKLHHGGYAVYALLEMTARGIADSHATLARHAQALARSGTPQPIDMKEYHTHRLIHDLNVPAAKAASEAAALIYAHAILDAALQALCELSTRIDRKAWLDFLDRRQMTISDLRTHSVAELEQKIVTEELMRLERHSVLTKSDMLFRIIKPTQTRGIAKRFRFSRDRLAELDQLRHDLVHKLGFHLKFRQVHAKLEYLLRTGEFFHNLLVRRYSILTIEGLPDAKRKK